MIFSNLPSPAKNSATINDTKVSGSSCWSSEKVKNTITENIAVLTGVTITPDDWVSGAYTIVNPVIKEKSLIDVYYAANTDITPYYTQSNGRLTISVDETVSGDIVIECLKVVNAEWQ